MYLSQLELINKCNQNIAGFPHLTFQSQVDSKLCSLTYKINQDNSSLRFQYIKCYCQSVYIHQYPMLRVQNSKAHDDWMERSQRKIQPKDELAWPAYLLMCLPHVYITCSHVLVLNSTSLLAVTCPCKNQVGWSFGCPYRNVEFFCI